MKVEKIKESITNRGSRSIHYDIPARWAQLSIYYYTEHHELRFIHREGAKRKNGTAAGSRLVSPRMEAPNNAVLAIAEAYLLTILKRYRMPKMSRPKFTTWDGPHSYYRAERMWHDILDRFFGASTNVDWIHIDYHAMLDVKRELDERGYC